MTNNNLIDILLPTYNGSKYISVLLDSLFDQTFQDWHLYVRDDHSKDNTVAIIEEYSKRYPGKITLLDDGLGNLGIDKNFSTLLATSKAPYACFCDQDDQWMKDKLEVSLNAIQKLEKEVPNKPCLVYSNLQMVDENLNVIAESRWKEDNIKPHYLSLGKLLMQNPINGCVMIMNRRLVDLANPVPKEALWFDHWVSVVAAAAGKVDYIDRTTINYRIHEYNASRGENRVTKTEEEDQLSRKLNNKNFVEYYARLKEQALAVKKRISENGYDNPKADNTIYAFTTLKEMNPISRRWVMIKNGFFKHTWAATFKWLLRI